MKTGPSIKQRLLSFLRNESGNFGIITAIVLPVALASAGVAIDLTRMIQVQSELQNAADSAALAAASQMADKGISEDEAQAYAKKFLAAQAANLFGTTGASAADDLKQFEDDAHVAAKQTPTGGTSKSFEVTVTGHYDLAMNSLTSLLGITTVPIDVTSTAKSATESKNALSMYLVLDKSGSMAWVTDTVNASKRRCDNYNEAEWPDVAFTRPCYISKIEALKAAVASLADQLDKADPDREYVRTAAVSYNLSQQTPVAFDWGTTKTLNYVNALAAEGGTDSSAAIATAYSALNSAAETNAHKAKNGQVPSRYIIFMTDGDNNYASANTSTLATCKSAKDAGMEIYTVAFMAPTGGKNLLKNCSSGTSYYYEAAQAADLVAAFKSIGEKAAASMSRLTN